MCPVNDVINKRFKIIVCPACQKVNKGKYPKNCSKDYWMDSVEQPPWSVGYKQVHRINHSYHEVTRKVFKVQVVSLWGVEGDPVHQGDHHR